MQLAKRLKAIKPSPTLSLNAKAKAMAAKGLDVVSFAAGEPDFDTPAHIKQAAIKSLESGFTKYTATAGIPELRAAICRKLERENQLSYTPEQVLVSAGAKHSLYNIFQALLQPGDEVVIFAPYWVSYPDMVRLADGVPVIVETNAEDDYAPDPRELRKVMSPKTRAVVINSPSNPSGAVLKKDALLKIAEVVRGHDDCLLITDDIYERLLYTAEPFQNVANVAPDLQPRTVVVNGFSKAFSMTGWRLGYAAGPKELIAAMQMIQDQSTSNPTSFAQRGAVAALDGPTDELATMLTEFKARRDLIVKGLNDINGVKCKTPDGAFYVFPSIGELIGKTYKGKPLTGSVQLSELLLEDFHLAVVPGEPFGAEGHLRFSFATSRAIIERGLSRLNDFVKQLT